MGLEQSRKEEIRWRALLLLDEARPDTVSQGILRRTLQMMHGFTLSPDELLVELDYLAGKGLIGSILPRTYFLTTNGVDVLEGSVSAPAGCGMQQPILDMELLRRREVRWRILKVLDAGRPVPVNKALLRAALDDQQLLLLDKELEREIEYLRDRGYLTYEGERQLLLKLTAPGVDLVEYNAECPAAIGRPPRYETY